MLKQACAENVRLFSAPTRPRARRVAAYCRVSTDADRQATSLETQMQAFRELIAVRPGWELVDLYVDEGLSGTGAARRAAFLRMIADCEAGKIDYILTKSISRFARNTVDCLRYVRMLRELGVYVYFDENKLDTGGTSSEMLLSILAAVAQEESHSLSENMKWGMRKRFQAGQPKWVNTYGFRKGAEGEYYVYEEQARGVRRIFELYVAGRSLPEIARILEREGIPAMNGGRWWVKSLATVLHNEKYVGDVMMQKTYTVDHLSHKKVKNDRTVVPGYYVRDHHEAIVDRKTFELAQTILSLKAQQNGCYQYPYAGFLVCPHCGGRLIRFRLPGSRRAPVWACANAECPPYVVYEKYIDGAVRDAFMRLDAREWRAALDGSLAGRAVAAMLGRAGEDDLRDSDARGQSGVFALRDSDARGQSGVTALRDSDARRQSGVAALRDSDARGQSGVAVLRNSDACGQSGVTALHDMPNQLGLSARCCASVSSLNTPPTRPDAHRQASASNLCDTHDQPDLPNQPGIHDQTGTSDLRDAPLSFACDTPDQHGLSAWRDIPLSSSCGTPDHHGLSARRDASHSSTYKIPNQPGILDQTGISDLHDAPFFSACETSNQSDLSTRRDVPRPSTHDLPNQPDIHDQTGTSDLRDAPPSSACDTPDLSGLSAWRAAPRPLTYDLPNQPIIGMSDLCAADSFRALSSLLNGEPDSDVSVVLPARVEYAFLVLLVENITFPSWHEAVVSWTFGRKTRVPVRCDKLSETPDAAVTRTAAGVFAGDEAIACGEQVLRRVERTAAYCRAVREECRSATDD